MSANVTTTEPTYIYTGTMLKDGNLQEFNIETTHKDDATVGEYIAHELGAQLAQVRHIEDGDGARYAMPIGDFMNRAEKLDDGIYPNMVTRTIGGSCLVYYAMPDDLTIDEDWNITGTAQVDTLGCTERDAGKALKKAHKGAVLIKAEPCKRERYGMERTEFLAHATRIK